jgi:cell division septation protein DedD
MRNNETGEFELVVGNRQLLSAFFIVVLLFAVAFAMGYVVGENTRSVKTMAQTTPPGNTPVQVADARPQPAPAPPEPDSAAPAKAEGEEKPADAPAEPTTQPAREATTQPAATPAPPPPSTSVSAPEAPEHGSYWQVVAVSNKDAAQTLVTSLKDKGFPASMSPGPNNLMRVLVGPYGDTASMGRAKTELEGAGFNRLVTFKK